MEIASSQYPFYWATAILAAVAIWYSFLIFSNHRKSSTRLPPGPRGFPLVGSLLSLDPELHTYLAGLARVHGHVYSLRLGSKLGVVISSPSAAREVLKDNDAVFANRDVPAVARITAYGGQDIVWNPNGPTWQMLRRISVREIFSPASLDAVYHLRRREVRSTVKHLYGNAGKPVDIGAQVFLSVLNVITSMLWGGVVEGETERSKVGSDFRELVAEITELLGKPNLSDFFSSLERFDLQGLEKKMKVLCVRFDRMFANMIDRRQKMATGSGVKDFLDFMLRMEMEEANSATPFTMTHVKALLMDMVIGGTDTTSNTIEFAMAEMMNKPETIKRAQEELDEVVGKDNIVEESHIPRLHYLSLVIKEALRLHPTLPLLVPHCPSSSSTVGGYTIPQGSRVFVNVWAIHRDPSVWENPLEFKPERFLSTTSKLDYSGNNFNYFPFGSGRRICAGISMAERMTTFTLASLLHSFDWKLAEGTKLDLAEKFGIVLKKAEPLVAIPTPRLASHDLYS